MLFVYDIFAEIVASWGKVERAIFFSSIVVLSACGLIYCFWIFYRLTFRNDVGSVVKKALSLIWVVIFSNILWVLFLPGSRSLAQAVVTLITWSAIGGWVNVYFFYCWKSAPELRKQKLKIRQLIALLLTAIAAFIDFSNFLIYSLDRSALYFIEGFKKASFFQFPWSDVFSGYAPVSFIIALADCVVILLFLKSRLARPGFDFRKASAVITGLILWQLFAYVHVLILTPGFMTKSALSLMFVSALQFCAMYCLVYLATLDFKNKNDVWKKKILFYTASGLLIASLIFNPFTVAPAGLLDFLWKLML